MKTYKTYTLRKTLMGLTLLLFSLHLSAQVQLVDLQKLDASYSDYQTGKIPVFSSLMHHKGPHDLDLVLPEDTQYDPNDKNILMAVIDNHLVLLPKKELQISNGLSPFIDLMQISNGFLMLSKEKGIARWRYNSISNGYLKFKGFAKIKSFIAVADTGYNNLPHSGDEDMPVTALSSTQDDDDEHDRFLLEIFLRELSRNLNPWDYICVYVDGVKMEMSAGAVSAHLRTGFFKLAGGNQFNPEYP